MVQNKQKSNKINIAALITCFMLIMVFVFGCVQYAFASSLVTISDMLSKFDGDRSCYIAYTANFSGGYTGLCAFASNYSGKMCAFRTNNSTGIISNNSFYITWFDDNFKKSNVGQMNVNSSGYALYSMSGATLEYIDFQSTMITFSTQEDAVKYIQTGEINNPIFQPSVYDESIPTPKNLEVYFDRKLNKPFNLADLCNPLKIKWTIPEDSDYSDYTLDVQIDVNYNKLNSISGIGTKPTVLSTGKVEFASCSATDKELNISATYDGWTKLSEKYQTSIWGLTGNYFDLWMRYKDSSGNYGNWVKVTINPDNSSTVIKTGLFDNGTNTTINKGYEEISGDNGEHVSGDYDNYYVNTLDDNISNNLTSLKNNYSNLVNFYKELFGFLPVEIWILLIGLVSTMVIIAIVMFVRG